MMRKFTIFVLVLVLSLSIFMTACGSKTPKADFSITPMRVNVVENDRTQGISDDYVEASITRIDDGRDPATFTLRFTPSTAHIYAVDDYGVKISQWNTNPLKDADKDVVKFKIYGSRGSYDTASGTILVELLWNDVVLDKRTINVVVN